MTVHCWQWPKSVLTFTQIMFGVCLCILYCGSSQKPTECNYKALWETHLNMRGYFKACNLYIYFFFLGPQVYFSLFCFFYMLPHCDMNTVCGLYLTFSAFFFLMWICLVTEVEIQDFPTTQTRKSVSSSLSLDFGTFPEDSSCGICLFTCQTWTPLCAVMMKGQSVLPLLSNWTKASDPQLQVCIVLTAMTQTVGLLVGGEKKPKTHCKSGIISNQYIF